MKKKLEAVLNVLARLIIRKYKPKIIAVTGSVGKTSTKEAIFTAVQRSLVSRQTIKNYNNEIGVPLTIIGRKSENASVGGWIRIILFAIRLLLKRDAAYPKLLVLEVAADKPGDIAYLRKIITPDIVVITSIAGVHLEAFGTIEAIAKEKLSLADNLSNDTPIFINTDNAFLRKEFETNKERHYIPYGFTDPAIIRAGNDRLLTDKKNRYRVLGIEVTVQMENEQGKLLLFGVISKSHIYSALAAVGVARALGIKLASITEDLRRYHVPAGRMKLLPGVKQTLIIDDTYNASPAACEAAMESVFRIPLRKEAKRWVVLGDMLELGSESAKLHQSVGAMAFQYEFHYVVTVGALAKNIAKGAIKAGMDKDHVYSFDDHKAAGAFIEDRIEPHDVLVVKGSQGARMEKIVKELISDPARASELLVRQDSTWISR